MMTCKSNEDGCNQTDIKGWDCFTQTIKAIEDQKDEHWTFRGQSQDWPLTTKLERALKSWCIPMAYGPRIEVKMQREFQRRYQGPDRDLVRRSFYCLALMQHHGAPTRL